MKKGFYMAEVPPPKKKRSRLSVDWLMLYVAVLIAFCLVILIAR